MHINIKENTYSSFYLLIIIIILSILLKEFHSATKLFIIQTPHKQEKKTIIKGNKKKITHFNLLLNTKNT